MIFLTLPLLQFTAVLNGTMRYLNVKLTLGDKEKGLILILGLCSERQTFIVEGDGSVNSPTVLNYPLVMFRDFVCVCVCLNICLCPVLCVGE